jgi:hypothetical protein
LHDDELSCLLPFLSLADLAHLVRCSRRFSTVLRKRRSLQFHLNCDASVVPMPSSVLTHHVTSIELRHRGVDASIVTRSILQRLQDCPQLTSLQLEVLFPADEKALMQDESAAQVVEALKAVLPTQLKSFSVMVLTVARHPRTLAPALCAAIPVMTQLTELNIGSMGLDLDLPTGILTQFHRLRKLAFSGISWTSELLAELKQLSGLRELVMENLNSSQLTMLCAPPHSLRLERLKLTSRLSLSSMSALLHIPTLTALEPAYGLHSNAWTLLPQLPLLQRLSFSPYDKLTAEETSLMSSSLSGCKALTDLSLNEIEFEEAATTEQIQARWTDILRSVPNLRHLHVEQDRIVSFLAVLPTHVPLLEDLSLWCIGASSPEPILLQLTHPSVRRVQLASWNAEYMQEQMRALVRSARLPQLDHISCCP